MTVNRHYTKRGVRDLAVAIGIAVITALISAGLMKSAAQENAAADISQTVERTAAQYREMVGRVERSLESARRYGVDPVDIEAAGRYFTTSVFPGFNNRLSGISLVEQDGSAYYLLSDGTRKDVRAEGGYKPEDRKWYAGALTMQASGKCHWTPVYEFHTLQKPGITASLSWKGSQGKDVVLAYDVLLDDFSHAVSNLTHRAAGLTFIFDVIEDQESLYVSDADKRLAGAGFEVWRKQSSQGESGVFVKKDTIEGRIWWFGFAPLEELKPAKWICVMVPRDSLIGAGLTVQSIGITAILIAVIIATYLILAGRRNRPLFEGDVNPDQIQTLIEKGENSLVEFKSTMRMNLHSRKPGREIELAWLKGIAAFLNADGGTLLLGVTDAGEITGLEQDVFENEDKCRLHFKNLIAKGLGADSSKFIRFTLIPVEGKTVGVVECLKSSRPVYLRDGNKETFYIRNGPSSDELPASRMVDYIEEHWK